MTSREASKLDYNRAYNAQGSVVWESLFLGCLQRIADATELMAKRHTELIDRSARFEREAKVAGDRVDALLNQRAALRGVITKLKAKRPC